MKSTVASNTLSGLRSICSMTGALLGFLICSACLMAGNGQAKDATLTNNPYINWTKTQQAVGNGYIDTESWINDSIEKLADEVDIEDIRFGPPDCAYQNPQVSVSPSGPQWAEPGTPVEYVVTVTNTSSTSCDYTNFDMSVTAPPGWDVEMESKTLQIAPGWSTATLGMVITSPSQVRQDSYDIKITADNKLLSIGSSATTTYVVESDKLIGTCIARRPLLDIQPVITSGRVGKNVDYIIYLTNQDSSHCKESNFIVTHKIAGELKSKLSSSRLNLLPAETGSIILSVTTSEKAANGFDSLEVDVTGPDELVHVVSAAVNLIQKQGCIPAKPSLEIIPDVSGSDIDTTFTYSIMLINNDPPTCEDSKYDLTITFMPDGWSGNLSIRQFILSSGKSGSANLAVNLPSTDLAGIYKLQVGVSDANRLEHAMTKIISHVVNNEKTQ